MDMIRLNDLFRGMVEKTLLIGVRLDPERAK